MGSYRWTRVEERWEKCVMTERGSDFQAFVADLPATHEIALMAENVSTAYYRALRAGWEHDQLVGDALSSLHRGGVGLVVRRLESLADNPPISRSTGKMGPRPKRAQHEPLPECSACGQPYPRHFQARPGQTCQACGDSLSLTVYVTRWS